jgi:signal transduction histidine kinase/CheY-like chemotaxis protein
MDCNTHHITRANSGSAKRESSSSSIAVCPLPEISVSDSHSPRPHALKLPHQNSQTPATAAPLNFIDNLSSHRHTTCPNTPTQLNATVTPVAPVLGSAALSYSASDLRKLKQNGSFHDTHAHDHVHMDSDSESESNPACNSCCGSNSFNNTVRWLFSHRSNLPEIIVIIACSLLVIVALLHNQQAQDTFLDTKLHQLGDQLGDAVASHLEFEKLLGGQLQTTFASQPNTTLETFLAHTDKVISGSNLPISHLEWLAHVSSSERVAFEQRYSAFYGRRLNMTFTSGPTSNQAQILPPQDEYYPVTYVSTAERNNIILDDRLYEPAQRPALLSARSTAVPVLSRPVQMARLGSQVIAGIAYFPVYSSPWHFNTTGASSADLIAHSAGMVSVVFCLCKVLVTAVKTLDMVATTATLCDTTNSSQPLLVAHGTVDGTSTLRLDFSKRFYNVDEAVQRAYCPMYSTANSRVSHIPVLGRQWTVVVSRADGFNSYHASEYTMQELVWVSVCAGLVISTFLIINARKLRRRARENGELLEQAEAANEAKSTFVAFLCHELRNPLHAIISAVDELEETTVATEVTSALAIGSQTMLSIVNDILDMSKIEAGAFEITMGTMSIRSVLKAVMSSFHTWANASEIELVLVIDSQMPDLIYSDATRVTQVLNNLVSNALKFSADGGSIEICANVEFDDMEHKEDNQDTAVTVTITDAAESDVVVMDVSTIPVATPQRRLGTLVLSVRDHGAGMTPEQVQEIFVPYSQLATPKPGTAQSPSSIDKRSKSAIAPTKKKRRNIAGTGIGLTIVSTIIQALDGKVVVESEIGLGSVFHIFLPLFAAPPKQVLRADVESESVSHADQRGTATTHELHGNIIINDIDQIQARCITPSDDHKHHTMADTEASADVAAASASDSGQVLLVVDDNRMNRRIIIRHATKLLPDVQLVEACNGQEAVDFMNTADGARVVCICMDLNMPVLGGLEATQIILANQLLPTKPIVIGVTANAFAEDRQRCFDVGMSDVLPKPFRKKQFEEMIVSRFKRKI